MCLLWGPSLFSLSLSCISHANVFYLGSPQRAREWATVLPRECCLLWSMGCMLFAISVPSPWCWLRCRERHHGVSPRPQSSMRRTTIGSHPLGAWLEPSVSKGTGASVIGFLVQMLEHHHWLHTEENVNCENKQRGQKRWKHTECPNSTSYGALLGRIVTACLHVSCPFKLWNSTKQGPCLISSLFPVPSTSPCM